MLRLVAGDDGTNMRRQLLCSPLRSCDGGEGGGFGSAVSGTAAPETPKRKSAVPLLNLHWDVLPAKAIERTIWARASVSRESSVDDQEVEELEKLFSRTMASPYPTSTREAGGRRDAGDRVGLHFSGAQTVGARAKGAFFGSAFPGGNSGGSRVKKVQLLDVGRGNNVAIGLRSFKLAGGLPALARAIGDLDPQGTTSYLLTPELYSL